MNSELLSAIKVFTLSAERLIKEVNKSGRFTIARLLLNLLAPIKKELLNLETLAMDEIKSVASKSSGSSETPRKVPTIASQVEVVKELEKLYGL